MHWAGRFAVAGAVLLAVAVAIPVLVPFGSEYTYSLEPAANHSGDLAERETIQYRELSAPERDLFDRLLGGNGTVTRTSRVTGSHFEVSTDGSYPRVVHHEGRSYVFDGTEDWTNRTVRVALPPVLFAGFVVLELLAVIAVGRRRLRRRLRRR